MVLFAVPILFLISFLLLVLNRFNLRPGYSWFLAIGGSITTWALLIFSYNPEPQDYVLIRWDISPLFSASPSLLLDTYSWPFAVGIATLMISVLFTDVARVNEIHPGSWAASLATAGVGILAVVAANPLTLLLAWSILDISETYTLLRAVSSSELRERVIVSFSSRVVGLFLVIAAIIRAEAAGVVFTFANVPAESAGYLVLAAGLRLGVFPPHPPFLEETHSRRNLATMIRLVPVAASLVLLVRIAEVGVSPRWEFALMITSVWALVYGSLTWATSPDELDGRPFWIFGISALAIAGTLQMQPFATLAWGLALLFSGGMIFLYSARSRRFNWLLSLGLLGFSAIPFTPAWGGTAIFHDINLIYSLIIIFGLAILILGYTRHMLRPNDSIDEIERWVWLVYPLGLAILPLTHFGLIRSLGGLNLPNGGVISLSWWGGVIAVGLAVLIWSSRRHQPAWTSKVIVTLRNAFSLGWLYRILWWAYQTTSRLISYLGQLLEGEGGVLWAVLIIILLVLIIVQPAGGG